MSSLTTIHTQPLLSAMATLLGGGPGVTPAWVLTGSQEWVQRIQLETPEVLLGRAGWGRRGTSCPCSILHDWMQKSGCVANSINSSREVG